MKSIRSLHALFFSGALAAAVSSCSTGQNARQADSLTATLDSLVADRYGPDAAQAPGCAIIVARGDSILYEHYQGLADIPSGAPIDSSTQFCIASCSKQFTVAALLQQVAEGKAQLTDSPAKYLPALAKPIWQTISLADLAGHTSGLPDARDRSDRNRCVFATDSESVAFFPSVDSLLFAPGTVYDYQNPTFLLLAQVVETLSGVPFCEYAAEHVFKPAGMGSTYYFDPDKNPGHQAHAYAPSDTSGVWDEYDYGEETFFATRPDGGIYSTARDLLRWQLALSDGAIVPDSLLRQAQSPRIDVSVSPLCDYQQRPNTFYGLGWFVDNTPGAPLKIYHTGDNGGFQAFLCRYPATNTSVIILENRHDCDRWPFTMAVEDALRKADVL